MSLHPVQPFHFVSTVHKPSHFPAPVDVFDGTHLSFALRYGSKIVGVTLEEEPGASVRLTLHSDMPLSDPDVRWVSTEISSRFDMDRDLTSFMELSSHDPLLAPVVSRWPGMRASCAYSMYELFCIAVVLQNAPVRRSASMLQRLVETYGVPLAFEGLHVWAFWCPEALADEDELRLRGLGLGYRAATLKRGSQFFLEHPTFEYDLRGRPKDEAAVSLKKIPGVGPATAWYLLFECLKHCDAFDYVSPWECRILSRILFGVSDATASNVLSAARERWGSWRMLAVHYLFEDAFAASGQGLKK